MRGFVLRVAIAEAWPHPTLVQDPPLSKSIKEHQRLKYYWVHQHFHPLIISWTLDFLFTEKIRWGLPHGAVVGNLLRRHVSRHNHRMRESVVPFLSDDSSWIYAIVSCIGWLCMDTRHESITGAYGCPMGTIPTEFLPSVRSSTMRLELISPWKSTPFPV